MKLKKIILAFIVLIVIYFIIYKPSKLLNPFSFIKDLLFLPAHEITMSIDLKDSIINSLQEDIVNLEKLNNINLSISDFDIINATIIARNKEYWFNTLTINRGENDGIMLDMAVIDSDGLIGRISSVTNNTAIVKLITTSDIKNKVSAVIRNNKENIYGIINGYDSKNNLLNLVISDNKEIEKDSKVETTGMGGIFPSGILIGKVYDVIKKSDGVTNIVRIIPSGNIEGDRYVTVLLRKEVSTS